MFQPSATSATTPSRRSPFPPTNTGGRGCCTAGGVFTAPSARWYLPSKVNGPPPSKPVADDRPLRGGGRSASPGLGIVMPIASYSGSYHPAPMPDVEPAAAQAVERSRGLRQHRRRPQRLAEHERPEPHRVRARASAPSVVIGSYAPLRSAGPPYFATSRKRWSESQSESNPTRSGDRRVLDDRVPRSGDSPATE